MSGLGAALRSAALGGFRALPPRWRERVKGAFGALGHEPGWAQALRARELAAGAKRLDRWAPETAGLLRAAGIHDLEGASCLEFGSGHLLTEPLIYHLLGARRIVATDYFPILDQRFVGAACVDVDEDALVEALEPFAPPEAIRARWSALRRRTDWSLAGLAELGIGYLAPFDAALGPPEADGFDLIASCSVLEHVPAVQAGAILRGLTSALRPAGGAMVHAIHLEDHRDFAAAPFAFLAADTDWTQADFDRRGNRLRASDWRRLFDAVPELAIVADAREIRDLPLPPLGPNFAGYARDDLRTKRQVIAGRREDVRG